MQQVCLSTQHHSLTRPHNFDVHSMWLAHLFHCSVLETLPKVETKSVESLISGCTHEVAFSTGTNIPHLRPREGSTAKEYKFILDPFQQEAILCLDNQQSVLVSAHTSAGKTVVAEYALLQLHLLWTFKLDGCWSIRYYLSIFTLKHKVFGSSTLLERAPKFCATSAAYIAADHLWRCRCTKTNKYNETKLNPVESTCSLYFFQNLRVNLPTNTFSLFRTRRSSLFCNIPH